MKLYALSFILLLFDCGTHSQESLFDIDRVLSTCFKEWNAYLISISLCYCSFNNSALCQITLVTNKKLAYAVIGVLVDLAHPLLHIVEALHIRNVIDDNYPMSSPVVATGDGSESLLSCCVPDLQLDGLPVHLDRANLEVNTDRADVAVDVGVVRESEEEA
jgi:hypothetical protein